MLIGLDPCQMAHPTHVVDADLGLCRGLHEGAVAELARQVEALVLPHHALLLEVTLVADQHHGHVVRVLKAVIDYDDGAIAK